MNTRFPLLVQLGLALSLIGAPAFAQSGMWVTNGPNGGSVTALVVDPAQPAIVYAGTGSGVFRSADSGATWQYRGQGLAGRSVQALAIDPQTTSTVYAGTNGGVFKSTDSGGSWSAVGAPVGTSNSNAIIVNPLSTSVLYATAGGGIFKSTDAGATWQSSMTGIRFFTVAALAIDPATPATLYAGSFDGAFKSVDAGATWTALPGIYSGGSFIPAIAVDPQVSSILYAANFDGATVYKSSDAGATWTPSNAGLSGVRVRRLVIDSGTTSTVYAGTATGVYRTTDGGATWTVRNDGLDFADRLVLSIAVSPGSAGVAHAGFRAPGVFRTTDGGGFWLPANTGLASTEVLSLQVAAGGGVAVAGTAAGVYRSADRGQTWTQTDDALRATTLAIDPRGSSTLYAGATAAAGRGVFKSLDGGFEWTLVGLSGSTVGTLAIDPVTPDVVYAGTSSEGVFRSADAGATWTAVNNGLTSLNVWTLTIDPRTPATIYAGTANVGGGACPGVFKSTDAGTSWAALGPAGRAITDVAVNPETPDILYAASDRFACGAGGPADPGILKSLDGGASWVPVFDRLTRQLAIDPLMPSTIYAGTTTSGVFRSRDAGTTWEPFSEGLTSLSVTALALWSATAFAGTEAGGVAVRDLPQVSLNVKRGSMRGGGLILGSGTIASTPAGIDCGLDCSEQYAEGTEVRLTATPGQGSTFHHWEGCDSAEGRVCTVRLTTNRLVSAIFVGKPVWGGNGRGIAGTFRKTRE